MKSYKLFSVEYTLFWYAVIVIHINEQIDQELVIEEFFG